ncbi:MAG: hypothetical protein ACI4WT_13880 [Oligosphaeraceae bacterium]
MNVHEILSNPTFQVYAAIIVALLALQQALQRLGRWHRRRLAARGPRLPAHLGRPDGHFDAPLPEPPPPDDLPEPEPTEEPAASAPQEPSRPLLRRLPGAERSDYGQSPLLPGARPGQSALSRMLDDAFLTTEDRLADLQDDRTLPLKRREPPKAAVGDGHA